MQVAAQRTDEIRVAGHLAHTVVVWVEHGGTDNDASLDIIGQIELRRYGVDNGIYV